MLLISTIPNNVIHRDILHIEEISEHDDHVTNFQYEKGKAPTTLKIHT